MTSDLFTLVYGEQLEEERNKFLQELAAQDEELAARDQREQTLYETMQYLLEDTLMTRFPMAPITLLRPLRQVHDAHTLQKLHHIILTADTLALVEQALTQAVQATHQNSIQATHQNSIGSSDHG